MIEEIVNKLINIDPLERKRILDCVKNQLEADRIEKLHKAKVELLKYEL